MQELTFGEQVKIILSRKGMTIKELAERVEAHTGKPMSRQNMTQKLHRDNFQEQDMRMLAEILGCKFVLNIMETAEDTTEPVVAVPESADNKQTAPAVPESAEATQTPSVTPEPENSLERDITVGELIDTEQKFKGFVGFRKGKLRVEETAAESTGNAMQELAAQETTAQETAAKETAAKETAANTSAAQETGEQTGESLGDINPYTGKEYASNSVRMHPKRIGYVQVYDQTEHKWTDMTEWAFLGFQERKKALLGKDYEPPIYLD